MRRRLFIHDSSDHVAVALADLKAGDAVDLEMGEKTWKIELKDNIPYGHKVALLDIKRGSKVMKYGEVIGVATDDISIGSHVHTHNLKGLRY